MNRGKRFPREKAKPRRVAASERGQRASFNWSDVTLQRFNDSTGAQRMHELSIASGVVEKLLELSAQNPERAILEVRLDVGELSHINPEQLRFCYEAIAKETPLEGSMLTIEKVPALVTCPHCTYRGRPDYWDNALAIAPVITMRCPECGKAVEVDQGHECAITSVRLIETHSAPRV